MNWFRNRKGSKYGAKRTTHAGMSFASKGEANCYDYLRALEQNGEIEILQQQAQVYLSAARILYKPDFKIQNLIKDRLEFVEYKGYETPEWRIKRRLWLAYGPAPLRVYRGSGRNLVLTETLIPDMVTSTQQVTK